MKLPKQFIEEYSNKSNSITMFGVGIKELNKQELKAIIGFLLRREREDQYEQKRQAEMLNIFKQKKQ